MMTPDEFEVHITNELYSKGYWALQIPKNRYGAQPFDIISADKNRLLALDCKVCGRSCFPLSRIEANQWTSFCVMKERTKAIIGIICLYDDEEYFVTYEELFSAYANNKPSIKLKQVHIDCWKKVLYE